MGLASQPPPLQSSWTYMLMELRSLPPVQASGPHCSEVLLIGVCRDQEGVQYTLEVVVLEEAEVAWVTLLHGVGESHGSEGQNGGDDCGCEHGW